MNRLTDNDKSFGPLTVARWKNRFSLEISSGDSEDPENYIMLIAFGWAIRMQLPRILKPAGKYGENEREYGFSFSNLGNGYDSIHLSFGPQTGDSSTEKSWYKSFPWKQWSCVRNSVYTPEGDLFATEERKKGGIFDFIRVKETCPACKFDIEDFDGERITATCVIEEREWHRGEGWFKYLRFFYAPKIQRSLNLSFSAEVGPEKGSWKGGTTGHGIDMKDGETPREAFERYCAIEHRARGNRKFHIRFLGESQGTESSI